jgi:polysaccharide export outer membrane protein
MLLWVSEERGDGVGTPGEAPVCGLLAADGGFFSGAREAIIGPMGRRIMGGLETRKPRQRRSITKDLGWLGGVGMFLLASVLGCSRYPSVPAREAIAPPTPPKPVTASALPPRTEPGAQGVPEEYRIGPEDVLAIKVWDHDDLSREVPVSRNGEFTYPLIGSVKAAGRTAVEVERELIRRLSAGYLVRPQVSVTVKEFRSQKVHVVGEVRAPGTFPLTGPTLVMEVLSRAGGPSDKAGTEVVIIRPQERGRGELPATLEEAKAGEVIHLDLRAIQAGDVTHNVRLLHGDTVILLKAKFFVVFGEVRNPGQFPYEQGITVLKAIGIAGGLTDKAAANRTRIVRERAGIRMEIPARMNERVEPNDIVVVPESFF